MATLTELKNSPIYNLSMCSLENFHTCFIHWLGLNYPTETLKLFMPDKETENIKFENQIHNGRKSIFDLCVTMGSNNDEFLIVENKLKSFPTEEQLTRYQKAFEGKKATFILLSLAPEVNLPKEWQYLSYKELVKRMHAVFDNAKITDEYHKSLISNYISVIEYLSASFPRSKSMKYDLYDENVSEDLQDIYLKYRTSELCNYISKNTNLSVSTDFRNKQGIINVWCKFEDDNITFLIQIQKDEYRYCMVYGNDGENDLRESIATKLVQNNIWFNNCIENYPKASNYQSKKFCGYKPDFIYRYQTLETLFDKSKKSDITYQKITERVNQDISHLKKHKDEIVKILAE